MSNPISGASYTTYPPHNDLERGNYMFNCERMNKLLEESSYTVEDFCRLTNISKKKYEKIESGALAPSCRDVIAMAKILNSSTDHLLGMDIPDACPVPNEVQPTDDFGDRLTRLMAETNHNVLSIANLTGKSASTIYNWKNGTAVPDGNTIIKLSDCFGCSVDYLLGLSMQKSVVEPC